MLRRTFLIWSFIQNLDKKNKGILFTIIVQKPITKKTWKQMKRI